MHRVFWISKRYFENISWFAIQTYQCEGPFVAVGADLRPMLCYAYQQCDIQVTGQHILTKCCLDTHTHIQSDMPTYGGEIHA